MPSLPPGRVVILACLTACTANPGTDSEWLGTIDTLPNGAIYVTNPEQGLWGDSAAWSVHLAFQLGSIDEEGPELFGRVRSLAVDPLGRVYVLDGNAQEVRVFDGDGAHVRTFGRRGGGPGELERGMALVFDTVGMLWVLDPGNGRISVFDTSGTYLDNYRMPGSYFTTRWNGGFSNGAFYNVEPLFEETGVRFAMVRKDTALENDFEALVPQYDAAYYEHISADGNDRNRTPVPFSPRLRWRFAPAGFIWFTITDDYRVYKQTVEGDTVRILSRSMEPMPVSGFDRDTAIESLDWFRRIGGKIDRSRVPDHKPLISDFVVDQEGYLWVFPVTPGDMQNRIVHVFDPASRFLGELVLPVPVDGDPNPVITSDAIWAVSRDELGVESVVKMEIGDRR